MLTVVEALKGFTAFNGILMSLTMLTAARNFSPTEETLKSLMDSYPWSLLK
jgi:hypothetical protein